MRFLDTFGFQLLLSQHLKCALSNATCTVEMFEMIWRGFCRQIYVCFDVSFRSFWLPLTMIHCQFSFMRATVRSHTHTRTSKRTNKSKIHCDSQLFYFACVRWGSSTGSSQQKDTYWLPADVISKIWHMFITHYFTSTDTDSSTHTHKTKQISRRPIWMATAVKLTRPFSS